MSERNNHESVCKRKRERSSTGDVRGEVEGGGDAIERVLKARLTDDGQANAEVHTKDGIDNALEKGGRVRGRKGTRRGSRREIVKTRK